MIILWINWRKDAASSSVHMYIVVFVAIFHLPSVNHMISIHRRHCLFAVVSLKLFTLHFQIKNLHINRWMENQLVFYCYENITYLTLTLISTGVMPVLYLFRQFSIIWKHDWQNVNLMYTVNKKSIWCMLLIDWVFFSVYTSPKENIECSGSCVHNTTKRTEKSV